MQKSQPSNLRTLILDKAYLPTATISWERALVDVLCGRASLVLEYPELRVRSSPHSMFQTPQNFPLKTSERGVWKIPSVVRFRGKKTPQCRRVRFGRMNIWLRDEKACQYCGRHLKFHEFTYDHVLPSSRGGLTQWSNIVTCCRPCNNRKGNRTPLEAAMALIREPYQPAQIRPYNPKQWLEAPHPSWEPFLACWRTKTNT